MNNSNKFITLFRSIFTLIGCIFSFLASICTVYAFYTSITSKADNMKSIIFNLQTIIINSVIPKGYEVVNINECSSNKPINESKILNSSDPKGLSFRVDKGDTVEIMASGRIVTHDNGSVADCDYWTDANGIKGCHYINKYPSLNSLPFMALIGRFNDQYFLIGSKFQKKFESNGYLDVYVNDFIYGDNIGSLKLDVKIN